MSKFWELVQESVIVQGIVTVLLVGADIYIVIWQVTHSLPVALPEALSSMTLLVLGFYFGAKVQNAIHRSH